MSIPKRQNDDHNRKSKENQIPSAALMDKSNYYLIQIRFKNKLE